MYLVFGVYSMVLTKRSFPTPKTGIGSSEDYLAFSNVISMHMTDHDEVASVDRGISFGTRPSK